MNKIILIFALVLMSFTMQGYSAPKKVALPRIDVEPMQYRDLLLKIRKTAKFKIPLPGIATFPVEYTLETGSPVYEKPITAAFPITVDGTTKYAVQFFDKIFLKAGSSMLVNGEQIPLTCIHVDGQDNRGLKPNSPLFPEYIIRYTIVGNDFNCQGPITPGWPNNGGKKEAWDTFLYYEVKDPTIMLPVEAKIRYRWNEFFGVLLTQP